MRGQRARRTTTIAATGAAALLATALLTAPPVVADGAEPRLSLPLSGGPAPAVPPGEQLVSATATFGPETRVAGMPTSTQPWHQVAPTPSVTIDYGYAWDTGALTYHYSLDWSMLAASQDENTYVRLGFGNLQGANCTLQEVATDYISRYSPDFLVYDAKDTPDVAAAAAWDCAALIVGSRDVTARPYDAFVTRLAVTTAAPQVALDAPSRDRLVKGVWTEVPVEVDNPEVAGNVGTRGLVVSGGGKGVKVRPVDVGTLEPGDDATAYLWVRLAKPKAKLTISAVEQGTVLTSRTIRLRTRPAPAPPRAGRYSDGRTTFTVKGGKVRSFRTTTQTRCGGYPGGFTYTQNYYDFPTVRIPRNNEISSADTGNVDSDAQYTVRLRMAFTGKGKAKGVFTYAGPAACFATETFTAKRKGR